MYRPVLETWRVTGRFRYLCRACEAEFRRPFTRDIQVEAVAPPSPAEVSKRVLAETARVRRPGPCPTCGLLLPREAADRQQWWDQWFAVFVPLTVFVLGGLAFGTRRVTLYWSLALIVPLITLSTLFVYKWIGHAFPAGLPPPDPIADPSPIRRPSRRPAYTLMTIAVGLFLIPPALRYALRTPLTDRCSPLVVAPGQAVRLSTDDGPRSIHGKWGGEARVTLVNADELGVHDPLPATTRALESTERIDVGTSDSVERIDAHADVTLPDRADLVGRTLHFRIEVDVTYPVRQGRDHFRYESARLTAERFVTLTSPSAAARDWWTLLMFWLLGTGAVFFASILLFVSHYRGRCLERTPEVELDNSPPQNRWVP